MRRRELLAGLGTAIVFSRAAHGQQSMAVIGLLGSSAPDDYEPMIAAFRKGLSEAGYVEGKNVRLDHAWANDRYDLLPTLASGLVERRVSLILAASTPSAIAAKSATTTIPIVFAIGGDPVRTGLVSSLNRPGGNLTGAAHVNVDTAAKRLELVHELVPDKKSFGLLLNPSNPLASSIEAAVRAAAEALGLQLTVLRASTDESIEAAFQTTTGGTIAGIVIGTDPLFTSRIKALGTASFRFKIPTIYQYRDFVAAGGIMSYGGDIKDSYYRAGIYAGRILNGQKPADLPVQLSTKVELFINLKTAKALGIEPSVALVGRADEVIE
jgi:putative ABC transport system substrate-binding protein